MNREALPAAGAVRIPLAHGLREVVWRRVRTLSPPCQYLLTLAAMVGREFRIDLLTWLSDQSQEEVLEAIEEARAAGVVNDATQVAPSYAFSHALVAETLLESLSPIRRAHLGRSRR